MTTSTRRRPRDVPLVEAPIDLGEAATLPVEDVLGRLSTTFGGLPEAEAVRRLSLVGLNALRSHGARPLAILARQLRSYLLMLLISAAVVSAFVGETTDAAIILVIIALSVGLGFINEYRSEKAVEDLHATIRRQALVVRDGTPRQIDVVDLVPGDVVTLRVGDVVPADIRLLESVALECDESILTGESAPAAKRSAPKTSGGSPLDLPSCGFMGTVVRNGGGKGVVVATGLRTAFGRIALRLGERQEQTAFQRGLQRYARLLATVTAVLAGSIFTLNWILGRPLLDSFLFALAIAVGLTPQLLPAIVTVSLATGARRLVHQQVVVKRLVAIEDLGNVEMLFTDKTGTLTEGHTAFASPLDAAGNLDERVLTLGLVACEATIEDGQVVGGNDLDRALLEAPESAHAGAERWRTVARAPFDHERQRASTLADHPDGRRLIVVKGAPEAVIARCREVSAGAAATLDQLFAKGIRVVAVATKDAEGMSTLDPGAERDLTLEGFLCFSDPPKSDAAASLERLRRLGVTVKIVTGDNGTVAEAVCGQLGLTVTGMVTGAQIEGMSDEDLRRALPRTTIFARVTPEQKSRIIRTQRALGADVGFLGDGVNDAIALHDADVGISVDTAADVAKDAADVVLVTKDLRLLAGGVAEGRRIFANTIKYVLMGTSSNFGNMFSAAGASLWLSFLPMLPSQILLNNLLYDISELTIPTDRVDDELVARPSQWDVGFIRRFMAFFGPISSIYDFATFAVMIYIFNAGQDLFRSGWFVESLTTQTLVIFIIRTRRIPFLRSRPSRPLLGATLACAAIGIALPYSPLADTFGFKALPPGFLAALALMVVTYLVLVELGKYLFFRCLRPPARPVAVARPRHERRVHRVASAWTHAARLVHHRNL